LEYCEGDFIREYARLTKQQNIHIYRSFIRTKLEHLQSDEDLFELLVIGCAVEEEQEEQEAKELVLDMLENTKRFLSEDYDRIMRDIKHKINVYLQIAVGRARFLRNREADVRGCVEQTLRYIAEEMEMLGWKEELPEEMGGLFSLERNEFIDTGSVRFPRKSQTVRRETRVELEEMSEEDIQKAKEAQEREAYNPFSKERMKVYLDTVMGQRKNLDCEALPMESKRDLLSSLSAVAYGEENGYIISPMEGYLETNGMILRRFQITKEEDR